MTVEAENAKTDAGTKIPRAQARRENIWWTYAAASTLVLVAALVYTTFLNTSAPDGLKVFGSFWASGWAAAHHENPYAAYPLTWVLTLPGHPGKVTDLNLSPPALLPVCEALAWFRPNVAVKIWTLLSAGLFLGCGALLVRAYRETIQHRQILWFLLCRATLNTLGLGQDYSLFVALAVGAWLLLERRRELPAGVLLGLLIAAKPNYALWALLLVFIGRWRAAAWGAAVAAALSALPLALYGPGIYGEWMRAVASDPHWFFPNEVSLTGFAMRMGHGRVGEAAAAALLVASVAMVVWKRPSLRITSGIALSVGMLASPLAWYHYSLLLAGPLLKARWDWVLTVLLVMLMVPVVSAFYFVPVCGVAGWFLWMAGRPSAGSEPSEGRA